VTAALLVLNSRTFTSLRRHYNYRLFFSGQVISLTGTWMQNIALAWLVVELTHSPFAVGVLAFCRFLPFTAFGLVAGVAADRFDNRRLVILTQSAQMAVSAVLAVLAFGGHAPLWAVYVLAFLGGTGNVFDSPGRQALTFQMVGREELTNAVALNASLFNMARVIGPAVGGAVIAATGVAWCFALNAISFLAVLAGLILMRTSEMTKLDRGGRRPTYRRGIREGLAYVRGERRLLLIVALTTVVSTIGVNFHVLVPVLASKTLHSGPQTFGVISACFGAGALAGALVAAWRAQASMRFMLLGTGGLGSALVLLAPQRSVVAVGLLLFVTGLFFTLWTSNANAILQLTAPDRLRGRVLSIYLFAFVGLAPLGSLLAGWLADVGGTDLAFLVAGGVSAAATLAVAAALRGQRARVLLRPLGVPARPQP
jgi:MFS family permease